MSDPESRSFGLAVWVLAAAVLLAGAGAVAFLLRSRSEPRRVTVQHILISFAGSPTAAKRTREEADRLARETLSRARKGEDFAKLVRELSDDPGPGTYRLCQTGLTPESGEFARENMVAAFGKVGFSLAVGEIGMAPYDPTASPFGWHIIKRLK